MATTRKISSLIIHCAATPNGRWTSVLDIDHWHKSAGFRRTPTTAEQRAYNPDLKHIGYHWVIYTNGALATGRHPSEVGAHARGHNATTLSICLIGTDRFSLEQWQQLRDQVVQLGRLYDIPLVSASSDTQWRGVWGHRDTGANKLCPGFSVADWLAGGMQPLAGHVLESAK